MSRARYLPLVDTHAHINLDDFENGLDSLLTRSRRGQMPEFNLKRPTDLSERPFMAGLICPGVDLKSSLRAIELSQQNDFVFAAVGFHPNHAAQLEVDDWERYERLVLERDERSKIVALGETGLDRYWDDAPFDAQLELFIRTLELSQRAKLPVVIHSREANDDLLKVLREFYAQKPTLEGSDGYGVVHSFYGSPEEAQELVDLGFYLGFGGFVTYTSKKFAELWEVAKQVPADRILLETDAPYLTPHPLRGKVEQNEPLLTTFTAKRLAELRNELVEEIVAQTTRNARRLFKLPELRSIPEGKE